MPLLELKKLTVRFGGLTAVSAVDCQLDEHRIVSIIGPNGAGKTTSSTRDRHLSADLRLDRVRWPRVDLAPSAAGRCWRHC